VLPYIIFLYCFLLKLSLFGLFSAWTVSSLQFFHKVYELKYQITQQQVISMTFIQTQNVKKSLGSQNNNTICNDSLAEKIIP